MSLDAIRPGETILLDANILIYAIQEASGECKRLLARCAANEIVGILPLHILAEVMHVLMLAEARDSRWTGGQNPTRRLAQQPDRVRALTRYQIVVRDILAIGLLMEPFQREDILSAMEIVRQGGLLTNDALLAAIGRRLRIGGIASADRQFERVSGVTLYSPSDIEIADK